MGICHFAIPIIFFGFPSVNAATPALLDAQNGLDVCSIGSAYSS